MSIVTPEAWARMIERNKATYRWYKAHGICPRCRTRWCVPGHVYCDDCYAHQYAVAERRDPGRVQRNAYDRDRRARLKAEGICTHCGQRPAEPGKLKCKECKDKQNESNRMYRLRQRIKEGRA